MDENSHARARGIPRDQSHDVHAGPVRGPVAAVRRREPPLRHVRPQATGGRLPVGAPQRTRLAQVDAGEPHEEEEDLPGRHVPADGPALAPARHRAR